MLSKAHILKKFRRWLRRFDDQKTGMPQVQSNLSLQVGKLLKERGSELITMTTL